MSKKTTIVVVTLILGFCLGLLSSKIVEQKKDTDDKKELIQIEYGDTLEINETEFLEDNDHNNSDYYIFLLTDPYCDGCKEKVRIINRLYELLGNESYSINIIWKQMPSEEKIKAVNIPKSQQIYLKNNTIDNDYPSFIFTDRERKVLMITADEGKLIKKIKQMEGAEIIQSIANRYFLKTAKQDNKKRLVYFAMDGCPDCERIMKNENIKNALDNYDVITMYTSDSYGEQENVDIGSLFRSIYDIQWYPSFLVINNPNNISLIGEKPDEEVLNELVQYSK